MLTPNNAAQAIELINEHCRIQRLDYELRDDAPKVTIQCNQVSVDLAFSADLYRAITRAAIERLAELEFALAQIGIDLNPKKE